MMGCKYPNCLECEFEGCINDRLETADFEADIYGEESREKRLRKARNQRYIDSHKEDANARSRKWNKEHAERVKETTKRWNQENKQRIAAKKTGKMGEEPRTLPPETAGL